VVLRTYPFSETSKIIHVFTLEHGPQSLIAKGARRPRSKFGGLLETFTRLELIYYQKRSSSMHTLYEGSMIESFTGLSEDLGRFYAASVCLEMIKRYVMPDEANMSLYGELVNTLGRICISEPDECQYALLGYLWRFITIQGFKPDLENCSVCGGTTSDPVRLIADERTVGVCCERCSGSSRGTRIFGREVGKLVESLVDGEDVKLSSSGVDILPGLWAFTSSYIRYHLYQERDLSSLETYSEHVRSTQYRED